MSRWPRLLRCLVPISLLATAAMAITADNLRVEYLQEPLGVDAARPRFSWQLHANQRARSQTAWQVRVASSRSALAANHADVWDSGRIASAENFGISYAGPALRSDTRYFWQVRVWDQHGEPTAWSEPTWWQMGLLNANDWSAQWIGASQESNSPLLRRDFTIPKPVIRATAYAYASGWYRLLVNGNEITERVLAPVNSNYPKGLYYDAYDVTALIKAGANAIGLWLGYGYNQSYSKYGYRWNAAPAGLVQLELLFDDGTKQTIASDPTWRWSHSPIFENDIYHGESYDARREIARWDRAGFDASSWQPVVVRDAPPGTLKACPFPGLAVTADIHPVKITEPTPGVFIFDLGQNIAGWIRLAARGPAGTRLTLRHAEELLPDGTLDVTTNRAARATDTYITAGRDDEIHEPRFTYHGFRYVELSGFPGQPGADTITGRVVRAAVQETGSFHSSHALLNRLHANFKRSIAGNLVGIPTDTPSRDERTPCQMDSLAVEDAAIANFDLAAYYPKWLDDIAGDGGNLPNWTGDQVVLPYLLYQNYGDRRILERHFANMKQVVEKFAATAAESKYWATGYGDWAAPNPDGSFEGSFSEGELVSRAFYYRCARIVAETAHLLKQPDDAARFSALADQERNAFHDRFYNPATATYGSGRQVTSVLPLAFGLVPENLRPPVAGALRSRITRKDGTHLDTGIFGTRYLFETLMDAGCTDLAFELLTASGYPGYADQMAQGATTTWEQWSYRGSMQTHNHAMFAGPDATFFSHLGGIRAATPGFREIEIRPSYPAAISFVDCTRKTPMGRVDVNWRRTGDHVTLKVAIPVNTIATVYFPTPNPESILESQQPASKAAGVLAMRSEAGHTAIRLGSGTYEFTGPLSTSPVVPTHTP